MIKHQAIGIDVAYIDDQTHPNARRQPYKRPLHLKRNLSMIHEFNPWVKSHFHFDSNAQFNDFLSRVKSNYIVWPILYDRFKYRGLYDRKAMIDFFKKEGYLPKLTCRQELINWAHDFCSDKLKNRKLIVIQIRNNPTRRTDKNANISAWIDFFKKRSQSPDFYFVIIGEEEEIIAKLRDQSNISFSKDFKTSFEQDVALMQIAFLVMASPSGPAEFSRYCGVPSLIFGVNPKYTEDVKAGQDYPFASDILKIFWGKETLELIDREFDLLYEHLLEINWRNPYSFKPVDNYPHRF
ncbi:MAG: hypothetical protein PHV17_02060 [Candidatus Omnitrophica bacterium]|nr:hypothetical protein [Candidatus Omnitrophota bacterium]